MKIDTALSPETQREKTFEEQNAAEHAALGQTLRSTIDDINWIKGISKMILLTILTYFLSIGYYIITLDRSAPKEIKQLDSRISQNANQLSIVRSSIGNMNGKLNVMLQVITKQPKRSPNEWKRSQ